MSSHYRAVFREVYKASVTPRVARNKAITSSFRAVFEQAPSGEEQSSFEYDIENALTFLRSQRMHKTLLERYNPLHDLSVEERIKATARRVGLDMPVKPHEEEH